MNKNMKNEDENDVVVQALKDKYFILIKTEDRGKTPEVTAKLDNLEAAIRNLIKPKKLYNI